MQRIVIMLLSVCIASAAGAAGFRVGAQGARAMGMGLAYTAVADDASAVFFNPAGLAFQPGQLVLGFVVARNLDGTLTSARGTEDQLASDNLLPEIYASGTLFGARAAIGVNTPFGLPMRWENPATFSGRFISYTTVLKTLNVNPTLAWKFGNLGVGIGADVMYSKIQVERFLPASATLPLNIARAKMSGDLFDSRGYGWNGGVLWLSGPLRLGASYRSPIDIEHHATTRFTPLIAGLQLPTGPFPTTVDIEFPASLNFGAAYKIGGTTFSVDADRTDWASFDKLEIVVPALGPQPARPNDWRDVWAYRAGAEFGCGPIRCRVGYFRDQTPQPLKDVGPILADADRNGYAFGIGWQGAAWGIDLADNYIRFEDRTTTTATTDALAGTWATTGNELAINVNWKW